MRCEDLNRRLSACVTGELSRITAWRAARHLAYCTSCAAEIDAIRSLRAAAREWRDVPAPATLDRRIEAAIGAVPPRAASPVSSHAFFKSRRRGILPGWPRNGDPALHATPEPDRARSPVFRRHLPGSIPRSVRFAFGAAALAALLLLPFAAPPGSGLLGRVRAAGRSVRSWHAAGWKIVYGKRVPWEIWWRTDPFLFREQVGGDVTLDDGRRRVHVRPDTRIATALPSRRTAPPGPWTGLVKEGKVVAQDAREISYRIDEQTPDPPEPGKRATWTLSKATWLPVARTLERGAPGAWQVVERARYRYNETPPASATALAIPPGMTVMDSSARPAVETAGGLTRTRNGLTVRVRTLALGPGGVAAIAVESWLGARPLGGRVGPETDFGAFSLTIGERSDAAIWPTGETDLRDDRGRYYLLSGIGEPLRLLELELSPKRYLLYPLNPLGSSDPAPRRLELPLYIQASVRRKESGSDTWSGGEQVASAAFHFSLPLPAPGPAGGLASLMAPKDRNAWTAALPGYVAEQRAGCLARLGRHREAVAQYETAIRERPAPPWGDTRKKALAFSCWKAGQVDRAAALLRDFLRTDIPKMMPPPAKAQQAAEARRWLRQIGRDG